MGNIQTHWQSQAHDGGIKIIQNFRHVQWLNKQIQCITWGGGLAAVPAAARQRGLLQHQLQPRPAGRQAEVCVAQTWWRGRSATLRCPTCFFIALMRQTVVNFFPETFAAVSCVHKRTLFWSYSQRMKHFISCVFPFYWPRVSHSYTKVIYFII